MLELTLKRRVHPGKGHLNAKDDGQGAAGSLGVRANVRCAPVCEFMWIIRLLGRLNRR